MTEGSYMKAKHVPGTNGFVYTFFADLGAAEDLLEGVPPETEGLAWDTFSFTGAQKGKLVAITDLAGLFSPFDLYSQAAEKVAWNAIDTAESQAVALLQGVTTGVAVTVADDSPAVNIINTVVALKEAEVPTFPDGTYKGLISVADAAFIMSETGELGWTEASKYAATTQLMNGEIGKFRGVRFVESNRIDDHKTVIHGPDAWVWGDYQTIQAYRVAPGGDHADPLAQRGLVGWKGMWGMSLVHFDGSPAIGPASNTGGYRFAQVDLTGTA
jgi:N4-gp56 family major capsid protein